MSEKEPTPAFEHYVTICESRDATFVQLASDLFAEKEIEHRVLGSLTAAGVGLGEQSVSQRLQVPEEDSLRAKELLDSITQERNEDLLSEQELERLSMEAPPQEVPETRESSTVEILRIRPSSLAFFCGFFVAMLHVSLFVMVLFVNKSNNSLFASYRSFQDFLATLVIAPFVGGLFGLLFAWLYNYVTGLVGGIRIEVASTLKSSEKK